MKALKPRCYELHPPILPLSANYLTGLYCFSTKRVSGYSWVFSCSICTTLPLLGLSAQLNIIASTLPLHITPHGYYILKFLLGPWQKSWSCLPMVHLYSQNKNLIKTIVLTDAYKVSFHYPPPPNVIVSLFANAIFTI